MQLDYLSAKGEADAAPLGLGREEGEQRALHDLVWHAGSAVEDREPNPAFSGAFD